jgi:hypothetical protein
MNSVVSQFLTSLRLGEPQVHRNMRVIPLYSSVNHSPEYLTLGQALDQQVLKVTEASQAGSVPELKVISIAEMFILLLDGEELAGAKQNRVLNTTILLQPHAETLIPVSCTEQRRWAYASAEFAESGTVMAHTARRAKSDSVSQSLKQAQGHRSDQGRVWQEIDKLASEANVSSSTSAMHDVFVAKDQDLAEFSQVFELQPAQQGLLVLVNSEVAGFDILSSATAYQTLHPKLVKSYAMDAITQPNVEKEMQYSSKAQDFLSAIANCTVQVYPSAGIGEDYRFESPTIVGSVLVAEEHVIHGAFFSVAETKSSETVTMASQRRSFRQHS